MNNTKIIKKNEKQDKNIYCIMGPTACGKTDLAIYLAETLPVEIISVDSAMVYRGLDIGTAKPSQEILDQVPHHLINILEPNETYSAADFCQDTTRIMDDIISRDKIPLLVGGTMLYFRALQQGLSELPSSDSVTRERILAEAELIGWVGLHDKLKAIDPKSAARIHPNDPQRIERALEVYYLTGKSLSEHFEAGKKAEMNKDNNSDENKYTYRYHSLGLFPQNRELLHKRIEKRFKQMLSEGWIDEVKALSAKFSKKLPVNFFKEITEFPIMRMVGYRQIGLYLSGKINEQEMIEQGIIATRQLAKRQMTWLRSWPDIVLLDPL